MVRRIQCVLLVLLLGGLLICPVFAASSFPDVDGYEEFAEAVAYVNEAGIMVGDDHGNFNPYKTVTRAEMATIICRMLGQTDGLKPSNDFSDVPTSHWANAYVGKAAELGIVNGYGGGKFGPSDSVTYEQAVTMVIRAIGGTELATKAGGYPDGFMSLAEQHGFLESVHAEKGEALARGDIAVIIFNCAGFDFDVDADGLQDGAQID